MFRTEANIVWEQGVHLFSMVYALLGPCRDVQVITGARRELPNGVRFVEEWVARLECARGAATAVPSSCRCPIRTRMIPICA